MPTIILTGASQGIGLACTKILLNKFKCNVVAISRSNPQDLKDLVSQYEKSLVTVQGDVANEADCRKSIKTAIDTFGSIDGLILNAGILQPVSKLVNIDIQEVRQLYETNVISLFTMLKYSIPHLRASKGRVVFVSSGAATGNYSAWSAYGSSKAALNHLAASLAVEESDIISIALRPGVVHTPMQQRIRETGSAEMAAEQYEKFTKLHSEQKLLRPEEPAHVMASLVLAAENSHSGKFLSWDDEVLANHRS